MTGKSSDGSPSSKKNDFFNTFDYPTAKFDIVYATDSSIVGDLTIKDQTFRYNSPATISISADSIHIKGIINIDRSKFGVDFGTEKSLGSFDLLPDNKKVYVVDKMIKITYDLISKK